MFLALTVKEIGVGLSLGVFLSSRLNWAAAYAVFTLADQGVSVSFCWFHV